MIPTLQPISTEILKSLDVPLDIPAILRKRKFIRQLLSERKPRMTCRIAILGGSTTAEVKLALEIFLLHKEIKPEFYESEFGRFSEDVLFDNPELAAFDPQIAYIHTTYRNIRSLPAVRSKIEDSDAAFEQEVSRFRVIWNKLAERFPTCTVIQNNFDLPAQRPLGNLEAGSHSGRVAFINRLNLEFARSAASNPRLFIHDIQSLSAELGSEKWCDPNYWFGYKLATTPYASVAIGSNLSNLVAAIYGRTRKCLVLDLDNTLWGGVVGDDGVANLILGTETAVAESFLAFQQYAKDLKARGILLAVCSKNTESVALEGLRHPDGVLRPEDFAVIKANWSPKHENIRQIAEHLNIGLDSLVFVDDNPVERDMVRQYLPDVFVPEVGADPTQFPVILERSGCFEVPSISDDDLERTRYYEGNQARQELEAAFGDYGVFLDSLAMEAEIKPFSPVYLDRITQLTNKSNQFNLTTRRYTRAEIENIAGDSRYIPLYGRLKDKFGDNGLVTVVLGEIQGSTLTIVLWLMSCRVLKRGMEDAMLDTLVHHSKCRQVETILGRYLPTAKNGMVKDFYREMGFEKVSENGDGRTDWQFHIPVDYVCRNRHIKVYQ